MATRRIKEITNTATTFASDDFIALDGTTQGTRKMDKDDLIAEVSAGVSGDYLEEANNLSDVASLDTSKLNMEIPDVGTAPNEVPLSGQLGSMAFQDSSGVSVEQLEVTDKIDGSVEIADEDNCTLTLRSDSDNNSGSRNTQIQFQIDAGTTKGLVSYDQDADVMQMSYGGNNKHLVVDSSGNVTAKSADPVLTVQDTETASGSANATLRLAESGAGGALGSYWDIKANGGALEFNDEWNEGGGTGTRMVIDDAGRVGIANQIPGSFNSTGNNLVIGLSGSEGMTIRSGSTNDGTIFFADGTSGADTYRGSIIYRHSDDALRFSTNATTRWQISSAGHLISNNGLYGIDFGSGASTTLEDYEEGTWTPTYTPAVGSFAALTMDVVHARYVKVGSLVHLEAYIRTDNVDTTGALGSLKVTGLPFAVADHTSVSVGYSQHWTNMPLGGNANADGIYFTKRATTNSDSATVEVGDMTNGSSANVNRAIFTVSYNTAA